MREKADPKLRGLGRGLNALFEDEEGIYPQVDVVGDTPGRGRTVLPIESLEPGAFQPRTSFDQEALDQLAESIRTHGVLQPLIVRADTHVEGKYEIIAGERRWRAAQRAQLHELPVIVLELSNTQALEIALIENLQREDLDPVEEAQGYQRLMEEFGHTQEKLAEAMGKSRSHIANMVRILNLPNSVLNSVRKGELSVGHARALVPLDNPEALAKEIVKHGLSVRETEQLAAGSGERAQKSGGKASDTSKPTKDVDTIALEKELSNQLGMKLSIDSRDGKKGVVRIEFKSLDQLDELIQRLTGHPSGGGRLSQ